MAKKIKVEIKKETTFTVWEKELLFKAVEMYQDSLQELVKKDKLFNEMAAAAKTEETINKLEVLKSIKLL